MQLENILQAWWHSETLSPGEVPSSGTINDGYTSQKIKKIQKLYNQETKIPKEWMNIAFKNKEMKRKIGVYGHCYREHDLIKYQRDLHRVKDEIHNKSMKLCFGFYAEFDEYNKYIKGSLFVPHVNLFVRLTLDKKLSFDNTFFEQYEEAKQYLDEQAESINGGEYSSNWLTLFVNEFEKSFATPPSRISKENYLELLVVANESDQTANFNSFFSEDLINAKEDMNTTIREFLKKPNKIDINENRTFIEKSLHPLNTPMGRWPSPIEHRLSLMQQVAVNEFFSTSHTVSSVNGPPGTGKTTLLKDIFAEIVVKKALALLPFRDKPDTALIRTNVKVNIKDRYSKDKELAERIVYDIDPSISHYAAVVASSNNTAVENISKDLPKAKEIDNRFKDELKPLSYANKISEKIAGSEAWGMFSIPLGKGENIKKAASLLTGENFSFMSSLAKNRSSKSDREKEWKNACNEFKSLYEEVKSIRQFLADAVDYQKKGSIATSEGFIESTNLFWEDSPEQYEERQKGVLYQTNTLNEKRSVLFLKALAVLRHFLSVNRGKIEASLSLLNENRHEVDINSESGIQAIKAMWNTIHCICPVISTTFASFSSMYRGMPKDFIPYLFIDEAGQATPQQAVGALWRSKKVLVVGDPLQIEPVQTLQPSVLEDIRRIYKIDEELLNTKNSVQSIADRANQYGTYVNQENWIGIPLWVHRRCIEPMFSISNTLAYNGKMVLAENKIGEGKWLPCQGTVTVKQYVPDQTDVLGKHVKENMTKVLRKQLLESIQKTVAEGESMDQMLQMVIDKQLMENVWSINKKQCFLLMKKYYGLRNKRTSSELFQEIKKFEDGKLSYPSIYVITPFSAVKNEIKKDIRKTLFEKMYEWLDSKIDVKGTDEDAFKLESTFKEEAKVFKKWYELWIDENIGTVHTFQGKEADIVYFVTGTDASKINAAEWACKEPNLLNVAATRAKKEFYIIGDKPLLERFPNYTIISNIMTECMLRKSQ